MRFGEGRSRDATQKLADFTVIHKRRNWRPTRPPVPILIRSTLTSSTEYSWEIEIGILTNTYNETLTPEPAPAGGRFSSGKHFHTLGMLFFDRNFDSLLSGRDHSGHSLSTALAIASRGTTPRKTKTIEENGEVTLLVR